MATTTYEPIATTTISGGSTNEVIFSSISGYTDLRLVFNGGATGASSELQAQVNSDTGTNYSRTRITGNGTTAASSRADTVNIMRFTGVGFLPNANLNCNAIIDFMNYSNTTTYKSVISRLNHPASEVNAIINMWRSTSAITSIRFFVSANNFYAGSTFTLYGIANANTGAKATGGVITYDNTYYYHTFGASGTFTPTQNLTADILVVAGGGGGGRYKGGGGGAGGLLGFASQSLIATGYTVTVGAGGAGGINAGSGAQDGTTGVDSQFGALTLVKGGGGGGGGFGASSGAGKNGGSGGGGFAETGTAGGSPTSGQGFAGTAGSGSNGGAGGGSAEAGGTDGTGEGGDGVTTYSSWGMATGTGQNVSGIVYYAGGGSGGNNTANRAGGLGGGGLGGSTLAPTDGLVNTGGGGGGGAGDSGGATAGAQGGSGVVIVRYLKA